jgi:hypothetical protein
MGAAAKVRDLAKWAWERKKVKEEDKKEKKQRSILKKIFQAIGGTTDEVKKQGRLTRFMGMIRGLINNVMNIMSTAFSSIFKLLTDPKLLIGGIIAGAIGKLSGAIRKALSEVVFPKIAASLEKVVPAIRDGFVAAQQKLFGVLGKILPEKLGGALFKRLAKEREEGLTRKQELRLLSILPKHERVGITTRIMTAEERAESFEKAKAKTTQIKKERARSLVFEEMLEEFGKRGRDITLSPVGARVAEAAKTGEEFEEKFGEFIRPQDIFEAAKRGLAARGEIDIKDGLDKSEMTTILKEIKTELGTGARQFVENKNSAQNIINNPGGAAKEIPGGSEEHLRTFFEMIMVKEDLSD